MNNATKTNLNDLKAQVYDVLAQQENLHRQFRQLEERKAAIVKQIAELEQEAK